MGKVEAEIENIISVYSQEELDKQKIIEEFCSIIPFDETSQKQIFTQLEQLPGDAERIDFLTRLSVDVYNNREKQLGEDVMHQVERFVMLSVIDNLWTDHLDSIENLRQGIGLRGYGQRDPLVEYKNEAFRMFEQLISSIDDEIVHRIYRVQVATQQNPLQEKVPNDIKVSKGGKLGRNDPCPCGSGKKWKKCHYPNVP